MCCTVHLFFLSFLSSLHFCHHLRSSVEPTVVVKLAMSLCVWERVRTRVCVYMCACACLRVHFRNRESMSARRCKRVYKLMSEHLCVRVCVHAHACMHVYVCVCVWWLLIEAELTRQTSCGSLMAEFRMRRKPSMRQAREMWGEIVGTEQRETHTWIKQSKSQKQRILGESRVLPIKKE